MLPHQERVVQQKRELDEEIAKLKDFLYSGKFDSVKDSELGIMVRQYSVMKRYSLILGERIAEFPS